MKLLWGILVSLRPSICPSLPHAVSALLLVAYFMDYIYMWHKYNPWGDDVLRNKVKMKLLGGIGFTLSFRPSVHTECQVHSVACCLFRGLYGTNTTHEGMMCSVTRSHESFEGYPSGSPIYNFLFPLKRMVNLCLFIRMYIPADRNLLFLWLRLGSNFHLMKCLSKT